MLIWTITFACKAFIFIKFTEIWRVLLENSSVLLCFREEWENIFPSKERRDGYFHSWVYSAAETSLNITSLPDLSGKLCVNVGCFLFLLFAHSLSRVSLCVGDCRDRPHTNESELDTTWPQTLTFRWPWGQDGLGGGLLSASLLLSPMGRQQSFHLSFPFKLWTERNKHQNEPSCIFHFRCAAGRGPDRAQTPGALFCGPRQGDQPGCWLWRHHLPGGQTPVGYSVMLWRTSCLWRAVWTDPVGYHCSVCTPSAGSPNVCCHLL